MSRNVVSLTLFIAFMLLVLTAIVLFAVPEDPVARWADWRLFFTREQWIDLHITGGVLFVCAGLYHLVLNWKAIATYARGSMVGRRRSRVELTTAVIICVAVYEGMLMGLPPMQQLVDLKDTVKEYQAERYGEPPFGHAENSSLKQFCDFVGLDSERVLQAMRDEGLKGNPAPESRIGDVAAANGMTPQALFGFIMTHAGTAMPKR